MACSIAKINFSLLQHSDIATKIKSSENEQSLLKEEKSRLKSQVIDGNSKIEKINSELEQIKTYVEGNDLN